ncbi:hypothetical protein OJ748_004571 [Salmonella enterica]|nr:hypothetical protein [Salmonella enterica]EKC9066512.1 hypothetical protein [Salmonella enterica]
MITTRKVDGYAAKGGWLCRERWMAMPREVDGYAAKGGWLCRERWMAMPSGVAVILMSE